MSCIVPITDPDDPRIAAYRHVRERDMVGRRGEFIAEGEVVLRVLLGGGAHRAASLLIAEKRLGGLESLLETLPADTPVFTAGQTVMDAIAGFPIHRGVLAHGLRTPEPSVAALLQSLRADALVLALFGIANHDNLGGLFRNAAAFGVDAVLLDAACCDPLYRKCIRVSVGAALTVPFARVGASEDPVGLLERAGFTVLALSPGGAEPLSALVRPGRAALLAGSEGPGLAAELLERVRSVAVPMAAGWDSLNVATAVAIVLHHLTEAGRGSLAI